MLVVVFVFAQIGDFVTTIVGVFVFGLSEDNPFVRFVLANGGVIGFALIKIVGVYCIYRLAFWLRDSLEYRPFILFMIPYVGASTLVPILNTIGILLILY